MGEYLLLAILYVGDWIILTTNITKLKWLKSKPENEYEINDLNELHYCPGMELERNRETRTITMNQKNYINEVFKHFNMEECKPVKTPIDVTLKLLKLWNVQREMGGVPYKAGIGITPRYPHSCRRLLPRRPCHIPLMKVSSPTWFLGFQWKYFHLDNSSPRASHINQSNHNPTSFPPNTTDLAPQSSSSMHPSMGRRRSTIVNATDLVWSLQAISILCPPHSTRIDPSPSIHLLTSTLQKEKKSWRAQVLSNYFRFSLPLYLDVWWNSHLMYFQTLYKCYFFKFQNHINVIHSSVTHCLCYIQ